MPVVMEGTALVPPRRGRDCACTFCGLFRAHHYWLRAVAASAAAVVAAVCTELVTRDLFASSRHVIGSSGVVGALWLITTATAVLALSTWYQPTRRLLHMVRPRAIPRSR